MRHWQLQEAKAKLSEVVKAAAGGEPQEITVRGRRAAVLLSPDQYERLSKRKPPLTEFLRRSPLAGLTIEVRRDRSPARKAKL